MSKKITKLVLEKFRGATTETVIEFDTKKNLTLIFGENGTGKSSIADAIDFVCNKSAGSLKERSSTEPKKHLSSIGFKATDLKVTLSCGGNNWEGFHNGKEIIVTDCGEPLPTAFILRRSELLRLVEAQPKDRYEQLRQFINVQNVEASEQSLREAITATNKKLTELSRQLTEAQDNLQELWLAEGATDGNAMSWAQAKSQANVSDIESRLKELNAILKARRDVEAQREEVRRATENFDRAETELTEVSAEINDSVSVAPQNNLKLIELLGTVKEFIRAPYQSDACPVCSSEKNIKDLRGEIDSRLAALESLDELNQKLKDKTKRLQTTESILRNAYSNLLNGVRAFADLLKSLTIKTVKDAAPVWNGEETLFESFLNDTSGLCRELENRKEQLQKDSSQHNAIRQTYERVVETQQKAIEEELVGKGMSRIMDIAHKTRIEFTQKILNDVCEDCETLYAAIHPNESQKLTRLRLDQNRKGSVHQDAHFEGHDDVPPQAYFSESHLDTLGFCFWLAIAKNSSQGDALIVIDDAFTSVDLQHIARIIDLLAEQSKEFNQIIITTHQRRWVNHFNQGHKAKDKVQLLELGRWKNKHGINIKQSAADYEQLAADLDEPHFVRQKICGASGVVLERLFDTLTKHYECKMPRNAKNEYPLAPLYKGVSNLFGKLEINRPRRDTSGEIVQPIEYENVPLGEIYKQIKPFIDVRNQVGAHYNLSEEDYTDADVEVFARLTVDLAQGLHCPKCRSLALLKNKAQGGFKCNCDADHLTMLPNELSEK